MKKQPGRRKHIPQRTCIVCRTVRPKRELARVVRTPEGAVILDETGKHNGRGAYLCRQRSCWDTTLAKHRLEQALKITMEPEARTALQGYAAGLPQSLATESEENER